MNQILFDQVVSREKDWKYWCDTEFPEEEDIPSGLEKGLSIFRKLLLIRSWCPDRTLSQARKYIADSLGLEFLENKVPQGTNTHLESTCHLPGARSRRAGAGGREESSSDLPAHHRIGSLQSGGGDEIIR